MPGIRFPLTAKQDNSCVDGSEMTASAPPVGRFSLKPPGGARSAAQPTGGDESKALNKAKSYRAAKSEGQNIDLKTNAPL